MNVSERLGSAGPGLLIASDFDGTLSPIVGDPLAARPAAGAVEALRALAETGATVAVVTGRPAGLVVELGGLEVIPGLTVLGSYGAQRWTAEGLTWLVEPAPGLTPARVELEALGHFVEVKDLAVAIHTRRDPDPGRAFEQLGPSVHEIAARHGLHVEPGSMVWELRTPGPSKGDALRSLLPGHHGVFFAGDDDGDVAALQAIRTTDLPSVCVCVRRSDGSARMLQEADFSVDSPAELVPVLASLLP